LIALGTALEKVLGTALGRPKLSRTLTLIALGTALDKVLGTAPGRSEGEHPVEAPDTTPSYK
jgi:hypothetical protein